MKQKTQYKWNPWLAFFKRAADISISLFMLLMFSPLYLILFILVFISIGFPPIYKQVRLGQHKKPFYIYKFRTMRRDAEQYGPQLSNDDDERIVGVGKILRKWRLDELPQFWNVLKGDMSIVGPRPEREFYIQQLEQEVDEYSILFITKPGITSSGMVHYGYASSLDGMKKRAPYDIAYIKNLSLKQDFNILIKTVQVLFDGSGK